VIAIGIGANVGTDAEITRRFRAARQELAARSSASLYRSAPIGIDQADFLNTAVLIESSTIPPPVLLERLHAIEAAHGRDRARETRGGPRTLDLDILIWEGQVVSTPGLSVPHPRLRERRFALLSVGELLGEPWRGFADAPSVRDQRVELVSATW
jgi:2-amino-4-hydroxy-6-hydroxymethyldihydropteridine diphosphokinase